MVIRFQPSYHRTRSFLPLCFQLAENYLLFYEKVTTEVSMSNGAFQLLPGKQNFVHRVSSKIQKPTSLALIAIFLSQVFELQIIYLVFIF